MSMRKFYLSLGILLIPAALCSQITFTNSSTLLHSDAGVAGSNAGNRCALAMAVVDVNNDGYDDIVKMDNNRYVRIEYQQPNGSFVYAYIGDFGTNSCWGMSVGDVDHNGYKDVLYLGGSSTLLMKLDNTGTGMLGGVISLPNGSIFCQNGNFMDANNDGWEDIFACNDVGMNRIWINDGTGNFPAEANNTVINFDVTAGNSGQNDESGNYSSVWTDFDNDGDVDLFVAHCRQSYGPGDLRRTDRLFVNNGNGTYTEDGATYNLNSNDQDWTGAFGDIDNDGDFDVALTKHDVTSKYYINNGSGNMTVAPSSLAFGSMPMQSLFEDYDNDGFVDILLTGNSTQRFYRNNGNGTFNDVTPANLTVSSTALYNYAVGDLNHDGKIDIYGNYCSTYTNTGSIDDRLWINNSPNTNHFITLVLTGTASTLGGLGARAYIYGSWGVQTREVRASESYGTCNSYHLHFGLGSATTVDSVIVKWPSGETDFLSNQPADQFLAITEGSTCNLSGIIVDYTGNTTFCGGDSLQLTAPAGAGYSYLWSNGSTAQSIYATSSDNYSVTVSTGGSCSATSPSVAITVNPSESVSITADGPTTFCPGGSVNLTSSQTGSNTWSTNQTTQVINVTAAGTYSVAYQGLCQSWNSNTITVTLLDNSAPVTTDDFVIYPAIGTVTATGNDITWYDAASGGSVIGTGASYSPGLISTTTTYYAEDEHSYGGSTGNAVGSTAIGAASISTNTINGFLNFDVSANATLVSVQCSTDVAGNRKVELRNSVGTVISSAVVNIPVGLSTVTLNFPLNPGTNYQLGTNTNFNDSVFSYDSPRLVRSNSGVSYPYSLSGVIDITSGNNGSGNTSSAYYYFYNWQVDLPATDVCTSSRTPATINITTGSGIEENATVELNVYPNPATDFVNVEFTTYADGEAILSVFDMLGKKVVDINCGMVNGKIIKTINTENLASGVYNVKLTHNGKEYNTRVVVR